MSWIKEQWQRCRHLLRPGRFNDELAEEMRLHMDLRAAETPGAEREARVRFGNMARIQEDSREAWRWPSVESIVQDLRYGVRTLVASPVFTLTALLSLTLAIGANTAIFSLLNAVMLRTLPVRDPRRLVNIQQAKSPSFTYPLWEQIRDHVSGFDGVLAYSDTQFDLSTGGDRRFAKGLMVSGDYFRTLGVPALRGRLLSTEDDKRGCGVNGPVAVISHRFWQSNFDADPAIVGRTVTLDRVTFQIAGVTPAWFRGLQTDFQYDVAVPLGCEPLFHPDRSALDQRSWWWLRVGGRLKPGATVESATAELAALAPGIMQATVPARWTADGKKEYLSRTLMVKPESTGFSGMGRAYGTALLTLQGVVVIVLLIACANVANLLLARATARQRELSVRLAIGAGRGRIVRQLLTESLLLATGGALAGAVLASWGTRLLVHLLNTSSHLSGSKPYDVELDTSVDLTVIGFTAAVVVLTTLFFGLLPALRASATAPNAVLKEHGRGTVGAQRVTLANVMVALQLGLALLLLTAAALFGESFRRVLAVDLGFDGRNVVLVNTSIPQALLEKAARMGVFNEALERLSQVPGIVSAARSELTPMSNSVWNQDVEPEGSQAKGTEGDRLAYLNSLSPGYFGTMGMKLIAGRDFEAGDRVSAPHVIILGEAAARAFWGMENPIGKRVRMEVNGATGDAKEWRQVIGVVHDTKYEALTEATLKTAFLPLSQDLSMRTDTTYELRLSTTASLQQVLPLARKAILDTNKNLSIDFHTLDAQVSDSLIQPRLIATVSGFFGAVALLLAATGLYGVIAYSTARRKAELGLRMALGASYADVLWLVLKDIGITLLAGAGIGLGAAWFAGRFVQTLVYGVRSSDPGILVAAAGTLLATAAVAAYIPARRAARNDPMESLRVE